jgi:hypothetical protein
MLAMAAVEIGDPVLLLVLMESDDLAFQFFACRCF